MTDYELPALDYDFGALEPHYSARVLELHHEKHHAAYVAGLNQTLDRLAVARHGSLSANGYSSSSSMTTTEMSARAPRRCS